MPEQSRSGYPEPSGPPERLVRPKTSATDQVIANILQNQVEKTFYKHAKSFESDHYQESLYYLYRPGVWEKLVDREMVDSQYPGVRIKDKFAKPSQVLTTIRATYLKAIEKKKLAPGVVMAVTDREIANYRELRHRLSGVDIKHDKHNLAYRTLVQEELLLDLARRVVLSPLQEAELSREFPSLKKRLVEIHAKPAAPPQTIVLITPLEQPQLQNEALAQLSPIDLLAAQAQELGRVGKPPVRRKEEQKEAWEELHLQPWDFSQAQAEALADLDEAAKEIYREISQLRKNLTNELAWAVYRRLAVLDPRPLIYQALDSRQVQRIALLGLASFGLFGFKVGPENKSLFSILSTGATKIPPAAAAANAEIVATIEQFRNATRSSATVVEANEQEITEQPQEISAVPISKTDTKTQLIIEAKTEKLSPASAEFFVNFQPTPVTQVFGSSGPESGSPYIKIMPDLKNMPQVGIGDVSNENIDLILKDTNARIVRSSLSTWNFTEMQKKWPEKAELIKKAHQKGIKIDLVLVCFNTPTREEFGQFLKQTITNAKPEEIPDTITWGNELGWSDKNSGEPTEAEIASGKYVRQYANEPFSWIYDAEKGYPVYLSDLYKTVGAYNRQHNTAIRVAVPQLGWNFINVPGNKDKFFSALQRAGVDPNSEMLEFNMHQFATYEDAFGNRPAVLIFDYIGYLKQRGIQNPKINIDEAWFGTDYRAEDVQKIAQYYIQAIGVNSFLFYPVDGDLKTGSLR